MLSLTYRLTRTSKDFKEKTGKQYFLYVNMSEERSPSVHLLLPYITFKDNLVVVFTVSCEDSCLIWILHISHFLSGLQVRTASLHQ